MTDNSATVPPPSNSRLDSLCLQAERLIENLRTAHLQVEAMFGRPERVIADANATAAALRNLHEQTRPAVEAMQLFQSMNSTRLRQFQQSVADMANVLQQITEHANQARAMATGLDRLQSQSRLETTRLTAMYKELDQAVAQTEQACQHSVEAQQAAEQMSQRIDQLQQRQEALILAGGGIIEQFHDHLRTASQWCERLNDEQTNLRTCLDESRRERRAWHTLLKRLERRRVSLVSPPSQEMVNDQPQMHATPPSEQPQTSTLLPQSDPQQLAGRIRRLADMVREAIKFAPATASTAPTQHRDPAASPLSPCTTHS